MIFVGGLTLFRTGSDESLVPVGSTRIFIGI
jgi:hypothetical protein